MACNCNCNRIVKTTSIEEVGDIVELIIPDMELHHGQHVRICFAQTPPAITTPGPLKVDVVVNGVKVPVIQSRMNGAYGAVSFLYTDQLQQCCNGTIKARQYIDVIYSSDTISFNYVGPCHCLPRANVEFPRVPVPAPPANTRMVMEKVEPAEFGRVFSK